MSVACLKKLKRKRPYSKETKWVLKAAASNAESMGRELKPCQAMGSLFRRSLFNILMQNQCLKPGTTNSGGFVPIRTMMSPPSYGMGSDEWNVTCYKDNSIVSYPPNHLQLLPIRIVQDILQQLLYIVGYFTLMATTVKCNMMYSQKDGFRNELRLFSEYR